MLSNLCIDLSKPLILWCDNLGAIHLSINSILHTKTKHVELDIYYVRDLIYRKKICIQYLPATEEIVDALTKPLLASTFQKLKFKLIVVAAINIGLRGILR